jgi:hypothetical protein|tara:strand:- start:7695 stop:8567 length:873 start_codon:yes stop_codon:yes gene_type:complete
MKVIWVLENVKQDKTFYTKNQMLMLMASATLWRKYHPNHNLVLYVDNLTYNTLNSSGIFQLWNDICLLEYSDKINKQIFWSTGKTKVISETKEPIVVVDHDFLIFKNIDKHLNSNVLYSYDEIASNWYVDPKCTHNKNLTTPVERVVDLAANVSLFYLPDPKFARKYAKQTLKNHTEFTKMDFEGMTANWMVLSEQLMLKQWLVKDNIPHKTLNKSIFDILEDKFTDKETGIGIWKTEEQLLYYKHYGVEKRDEDFVKNGHKYLSRCISAGKVWNIKQIHDIVESIGDKL